MDSADVTGGVGEGSQPSLATRVTFRQRTLHDRTDRHTHTHIQKESQVVLFTQFVYI